MLPSIVRLLRIASTLICLIVCASFVVFAVNQTKSASGHQQEELASSAPGAPAQTPRASTHESSVHKALDETAEVFTSPFAGLVSDASSEWATNAGKLLVALLVYGFGLGFIARVLRMRT